MILTVRTTRGREKTAVDSLRTKIANEDYDIKAVLYPYDLKGYIFIEGDERDINKLVRNLRHARGVIKEEVPMDDLEKFLTEEPEEIKLEIGNTVEVIGGPFKGEEAKVKRIDESNREATIELLEAAVPIPVTISINMLRKKGERK